MLNLLPLVRAPIQPTVHPPLTTHPLPTHRPLSDRLQQVLQAIWYGPGRRLQNVLAAGEASTLDSSSLCAAFMLSLLLNPAVDQASHRVDAAGTLQRLPGHAVFANPVRHDNTTGTYLPGVYSALYASPYVAGLKMTAAAAERVLAAAPGCLLLRWLADVSNLRREVHRLAEEGALPAAVAAGIAMPARLCQGVASRMHRTWSLAQGVLRGDGSGGGGGSTAGARPDVTLGVLLERLTPTLGALYCQVIATGLGEGVRIFVCVCVCVHARMPRTPKCVFFVFL